MLSTLFAYGTLMPRDPESAARDGWEPDAVRGFLYDLDRFRRWSAWTIPRPDGSRVTSVAGSRHELIRRLDAYEETDQRSLPTRQDNHTKQSPGLGLRLWPAAAARCPRTAEPLGWFGAGPAILTPRFPSRRLMMSSTSAPVVTRDGDAAATRDGFAGRAGRGDRRPVPHRPARCPGCGACLRHPRRLRAGALQADRGEPDQTGRDDAGRQRGIRGRCLRPDSRARLHLRDVLRRGSEHVQQHRRGLRGKVAGHRARRLARAVGAGAQPACCTTRSRASRPSSRSSRRSPWPRRSWTSPRRRWRRSTGSWRRPCDTSGRSISSCRGTRSTPGRSSRIDRPKACPPAIPTRSARPSTKPPRC